MDVPPQPPYIAGRVTIRSSLARRIMICRLRHSLRKWRFPLVGWLSTLMYLVVAGGVPLPTPTTSTKDLSVPFPCMNCPCGCRNAEQCWTSCCCHTPTERLAWARKHGVVPPRGLIVDVDVKINSDSASHPTQLPTCATQARPKSCCSAKPSCCSSARGDGHGAHAEHAEPPMGNDSIVGIRALSCQGFGTNWLASVIALPPGIVICADHRLPAMAVVLMPVQFSSPAIPPPVPPPRLAIS